MFIRGQIRPLLFPQLAGKGWALAGSLGSGQTVSEAPAPGLLCSSLWQVRNLFPGPALCVHGSGHSRHLCVESLVFWICGQCGYTIYACIKVRGTTCRAHLGWCDLAVHSALC